MKANWLLRPASLPPQISALSSALQVPNFVAEILLLRGIQNRAQAVDFFNPTAQALHNPFLMKNMDAAVGRLQQAISRQENVLLYGDYDVDGTTAVALMSEQLQRLGLQCEHYIPDRYREGYGVSKIGIEHAIRQGITLLITLDCGIKAHDQFERANVAGIDCIVCDHHQPDSTLPAAIVLNPKQPNCTYPYKELSGCAVAYKLLQGLYQQLEKDEAPLEESLDLVALSIGADIVELLGENRILCAKGLAQLNACPRPAFLAILELATKQLPLTLRDVVFTLAPRINAAGRIASGQRAVDWMRSSDQHEIDQLALEINTDNTTRRALDQQTTVEALAQIAANTLFEQQYATVVFDPTWHKGVVGIVASRLIETHYRPTIVLTESNGVLTGSARCMAPLHLYELLESCQEHLLQFGGHQFAAGLTLMPEQFYAFRNAFDNAVANALGQQKLEPKITIDTQLKFSELGSNPSLHFKRILQILNAFEPCGPGNLHPVFLAKRCLILDYRILKGSHLKLKLIQEDSQVAIEAIGFNLATLEAELAVGFFVDIAFQISANTYQNRTTLQLVIQDLCTSA
ncbi:MAG: single-stranded-DNA-specific exonuclease RecJ [Sphingomonadales bacterium]|nr:single-stranded-DNA-specific exonuclease RecJ [Sphingomonadales bacterium]